MRHATCHMADLSEALISLGVIGDRVDDFEHTGIRGEHGVDEVEVIEPEEAGQSEHVCSAVGA